MTILGRFEELVSRCVGCDLAEPESLESLGGSAPGVVDGILSAHEEAFIGSSPGIIKFDVGQILGDPVDLRSGVLRVACMMLM